MTLPPDYRPSDDEEFMNPLQVEYFRRKLLRWRTELLKEADDTLTSLQNGGLQEPDLTDRASAETDRALETSGRVVDWPWSAGVDAMRAQGASA